MFQSFSEAKNAEEEKKLIKNATPKSTRAVKKVAFEEIFWNCRIVGKQKSSSRAMRLRNWWVLSTTLVHCNSQYNR